MLLENDESVPLAKILPGMYTVPIPEPEIPLTGKDTCSMVLLPSSSDLYSYVQQSFCADSHETDSIIATLDYMF